MCLWRAGAAVLLHDHFFAPCVRMEIQVEGMFCLKMSPQKNLCAVEIPRVLG